MKKRNKSEAKIGNQNARKYPKKFLSQVGQRVWLTIPVNGKIVKVSKLHGYEIEVDKVEVNNTFAFFTDDEISPL